MVVGGVVMVGGGGERAKKTIVPPTAQQPAGRNARAPTIGRAGHGVSACTDAGGAQVAACVPTGRGRAGRRKHSYGTAWESAGPPLVRAPLTANEAWEVHLHVADVVQELPKESGHTASINQPASQCP
jgi:hypothetical protein